MGDLTRVLYAAPLWAGSTCIPRLTGLQRCGLDVAALDTTAWADGLSRWVRSVAQRFFLTPGVWAMNMALLKAAEKVKPDLVWIEKGQWVYPSVLRRLRRYSRFVIHYNTDDVFATGGNFWLHRRGMRSYDLHLTTNRWNVSEIRERYGVRVVRVGMGYDQHQHHPIDLKPADQGRFDVVFVGHWEPHTEKCIAALRDSGIAVQVWGHNWRKARRTDLQTGQPLAQTSYVATIAAAKIALCVLSRRNRNESTGRSFEIPAIGTCMLAERTAEHEYLYGDSRGAVLFSNATELVEKAQYYLTHDTVRQDIARTGHARCTTLRLSWTDHVRREWPVVERLLISEQGDLHPEDDLPFWMGFREGKEWERHLG